MAEKVGVLGGFFDPSGTHHREIAIAVGPYCDKLIVVPSGNRPDWPGRERHYTSGIHRGRMAEMTFGDLPGVQVDLFDIESERFATAIELEEQYRDQGEVWHVIGSDWIAGAGDGKCVIQQKWHRGEELWENSRFLIIKRAGMSMYTGDFPPRYGVLMLDHPGSSSQIRENVAQGLSITGLVVPEVEAYIYEHGLYLKDLKEGKETK